MPTKNCLTAGKQESCFMKSGRSIPVPTIPARPSILKAAENSIIGRGCEIRKGAVVRNCVVNADVVIGKDVHVENMVIDKHAKLIHSNQIIAEPEKPGYIRRGDKL